MTRFGEGRGDRDEDGGFWRGRAAALERERGGGEQRIWRGKRRRNVRDGEIEEGVYFDFDFVLVFYFVLFWSLILILFILDFLFCFNFIFLLINFF